MEELINYVVTGVWFEHNKTGYEHISHVMLHKNLGDEIKCPGKKRSVAYVLDLLRTNKIYTCKWIYEDCEWAVGAEIRPVIVNGKTCIRTLSDGDLSNNLDNLINMACITDGELILTR